MPHFHIGTMSCHTGTVNLSHRRCYKMNSTLIRYCRAMKYDFMTRSRYVWLTLMILMSASAFAQKAERDYIRKGNRAFKDSVYVDAEVDYRKALDANPQSTIARFNLGNTLLWQNKAQEAMNEFADAALI